MRILCVAFDFLANKLLGSVLAARKWEIRHG